MEIFIGACISFIVLSINDILPIGNQFIRTSKNNCYFDYKIKVITEDDKNECYNLRLLDIEKEKRNKILKGQ